MKILSKILFFFLFLVSTFYFLSSATLTHAAPQAIPTQSANTSPSSNTDSDVPNNLHNWTQSVMIEVMLSLTCQLVGVDPTRPDGKCLGINGETGKIGLLPTPQTGGAIGFMGNAISVLYTPPIHTSDYFKDLASNFGISKHAFAQNTNTGGTGFQGLTPLINVWSAFRNIVYLFLVIIFVVIGLAIMLRVKIDPRTVMTIQNQIPKIIIGILAVTFSFAIAGFLIDMMWVLIYLIYGIFNGIPGVDVTSLNPSAIHGRTALSVAGDIAPGRGIFGITSDAANSAKEAIHGILNIEGGWQAVFNPLSVVTDLFDSTKANSVANWLINIISTATGLGAFNYHIKIAELLSKAATIDALNKIPVANVVLGLFQDFAELDGFLISFAFGEAAFSLTQSLLRNWLPYLIAYIIIFFALLAALIRLWFSLIMAYVQILLSVVLAPFWIIGGVIPGSPISLSGWFKNIGANLLAFPVTIAMFMLGKIFIDSFGKAPTTGQNFVPPLIGNVGDPSLIGSLIGVGILLMTPNVVSMLKAALKAPKTDMGLGKAFGVGTGVLTAPGKTVATGFSFLAGQKMAKKLPFFGDFVKTADEKTKKEVTPQSLTGGAGI